MTSVGGAGGGGEASTGPAAQTVHYKTIAISTALGKIHSCTFFW